MLQPLPGGLPAHCVPCRAGRYQPLPDTQACKPCGAGWVSAAAAATCVHTSASAAGCTGADCLQSATPPPPPPPPPPTPAPTRTPTPCATLEVDSDDDNDLDGGCAGGTGGQTEHSPLLDCKALLATAAERVKHFAVADVQRSSQVFFSAVVEMGCCVSALDCNFAPRGDCKDCQCGHEQGIPEKALQAANAKGINSIVGYAASSTEGVEKTAVAKYRQLIKPYTCQCGADWRGPQCDERVVSCVALLLAALVMLAMWLMQIVIECRLWLCDAWLCAQVCL
jgi:hypothetical protein